MSVHRLLCRLARNVTTTVPDFVKERTLRPQAQYSYEPHFTELDIERRFEQLARTVPAFARKDFYSPKAV